MIRRSESDHLFRCRQLFHQFATDMYAKIESERLNYIRFNQQKLRVDHYIHLRDSLAIDGNVNNHGKLVVLPSNFIGEPRSQQEFIQDILAYVRKYYKPHLFITFTCNPLRPEILSELMNGQTVADRHDIVARVFRQKLLKFMEEITKGNLFGPVRCWTYSVEWHNRGLPHAHILVSLISPIIPKEIDRVISAEISDPSLDPILYDIVTRNLIHGPFGQLNTKSPCMKEGKCTKRFPKFFWSVYSDKRRWIS